MDLNKQNEYGIPQQQEKRPFRPAVAAPVVLITLILGAQIISQFVAHQLHYHPDLGAGKLYYPWSWIPWYLDYGKIYSDVFTRGFALGVLFSGSSLACYALAVTLHHRNNKKHKNLHGSARWAKKKEIIEAGLLPRSSLFKKPGASEGVYVGGWVDTATNKQVYLRHNGPEHVLTFAPTRSGKGVGLVLPTLLSWPDSVLNLDIKGENWALTAGWRKKYAGNRCLRFDISNSDPAQTVRFNPIAEVRFGTDNEVGDAQNLALMIADPKGKGIDDSDHWTKTSYALLTSLIIFCALREKQRGAEGTLPGVSHLISNPEQNTEELWEEMRTFPHPVVAATGADMLNTPDEEKGSIISTTKSHLSLYRDPVVANNVSTSDFKIADLQNADRPVSLYLVVNPTDKDRLLPLLRILITQTMRILTERMEFKDGRSVQGYNHRLLMLLDEFPSLGRMTVVEQGLAFCAGYGIKAYLITQDLAQLTNIYTKDEAVTSNCHIKNAYAPNKPETKDYLSKACGDTTVLKESVTVSGQRTSVFMKTASRSLQEVRRPLLTPDECGRLPGAIKDGNGNITEAGDMLIFAAGFPPIYGKQILYFKDPVFSVRAKVSTPTETDRMSGPVMVATQAATFDLDQAPTEPEALFEPEPDPVLLEPESVNKTPESPESELPEPPEPAEEERAQASESNKEEALPF
ncbi:type IV secretory system conjugative DNA transfer family protein [Microbulbifer sp. 2201CG32-9]|uniref:type IV secretory system conjugative DNA transfer family protein n=1 Tax=Microbulbifer sp. 2201CG32-9 TaxID=3232309 RepID=UPI00345BB30B